MAVSAWRVHDSGLVAVPGRFRRLGGLVRHHRGTAPAWPVEVSLALDGDSLVVTGEGGIVGRWPRARVTARRLSAGPPVQFVLEVPDGSQLLAASAGVEVEELLAALV